MMLSWSRRTINIDVYIIYIYIYMQRCLFCFEEKMGRLCFVCGSLLVFLLLACEWYHDSLFTYPIRYEKAIQKLRSSTYDSHGRSSVRYSARLSPNLLWPGMQVPSYYVSTWWKRICIARRVLFSLIQRVTRTLPFSSSCLVEKGPVASSSYRGHKHGGRTSMWCGYLTYCRLRF